MADLVFDAARLERLRRLFLERDGASALGDYWRDEEDVAAYDAVLAARIGWKWDAVFDELVERGLQFDDVAVLDWGCGSGVASRRFVERFGARSVHLCDRSEVAREWAAGTLLDQGWELEVSATASPPEAFDVLLISHVINELSAEVERGVVDLARRARVVIWVEAGTQLASRRLARVRDELLGEFAVAAPCVHAQSCPTLQNDRDWCHFFAQPPVEVFADGAWVQIGRELGIDLRSLPYSFITLVRDEVAYPDAGRVLGRPHVSSKLAKFWRCDTEGLSEITLAKSADRAQWRRLKRDGIRTRLIE